MAFSAREAREHVRDCQIIFAEQVALVLDALEAARHRLLDLLRSENKPQSRRASRKRAE